MLYSYAVSIAMRSPRCFICWICWMVVRMIPPPLKKPSPPECLPRGPSSPWLPLPREGEAAMDAVCHTYPPVPKVPKRQKCRDIAASPRHRNRAGSLGIEGPLVGIPGVGLPSASSLMTLVQLVEQPQPDLGQPRLDAIDDARLGGDQRRQLAGCYHDGRAAEL